MMEAYFICSLVILISILIVQYTVIPQYDKYLKIIILPILYQLIFVLDRSQCIFLPQYAALFY